MLYQYTIPDNLPALPSDANRFRIYGKDINTIFGLIKQHNIQEKISALLIHMDHQQQIESLDLKYFSNTPYSIHFMINSALLKPFLLAHRDHPPKNVFIHINAWDEELYTQTKITTSLGYPVFLDELDTLSQNSDNALQKVMEYFLFTPGLKVRIEPFFSFIRSALVPLDNGHKGKMQNLNILYQEIFPRHFYVNQEGMISLSKRWMDKGKSFGLITQDFNEILNSPLANQLRQHEFDLFYHQTECSFCPYYSFCAGYLRRLDNDYNCQPHKKLFAQLKSCIKEMK